jgi:hypothetical protein
MAKTLLYRLFGVGKIPRQDGAALQAEVIVLLDEGISGSITYLDFRAPGKSFSWRRQWYTAAIALTQVRLFALHYSNKIVDVPLTDERLRSMKFSLEGQETLVIAFDPALFHEGWSGTIEYRFHTPQAGAFVEKLTSEQK